MEGSRDLKEKVGQNHFVNVNLFFKFLLKDFVIERCRDLKQKVGQNLFLRVNIPKLL